MMIVAIAHTTSRHTTSTTTTTETITAVIVEGFAVVGMVAIVGYGCHGSNTSNRCVVKRKIHVMINVGVVTIVEVMVQES